jgi:hypothetical protein
MRRFGARKRLLAMRKSAIVNALIKVNPVKTGDTKLPV